MLAGVQGLNFPPEAGYPFDSHKERFYLMESHYSSGASDAAGADADADDAVPMDLATAFAAEPLLDNSGLRLHVTSVLRPHDAGVLSIGTYCIKCVCARVCARESRALFMPGACLCVNCVKLN